MKKICVLGLGYIGLPTAAMFATRGFQVVGVDINRRVVDTLNNGEVHIHEPRLKTLVQAALRSGNLRIGCQPEPADAFIIAVPTPLSSVRRKQSADESAADGGPPTADLSYVIAAAESIVPHLHPGNLVVLESTVPPRTTVDILLPVLERRGLTAGKAADGGRSRSDVLVAHCPERVLPGRILEELVHNDRVIGGVNRVSAEAARGLYGSFVEGQIFLTDATTAEMVKVMENTYRDVNIALANEFALVAEQVGLNVWEAIELANRHPRVHILKPGPGVGGHCIAVDPWFIVQAAREVTPLIQTARRVNDGMPAHVVELVKRAVTGMERPVITCLGLAYKADVDDTRESPAIKVVELLRTEGFEVRAYDPHLRMGVVPEQVDSLEAAVEHADAILVLTDHSAFRELRPEALNRSPGQVVIDARSALSVEVWGRARLAVLGMGRAVNYELDVGKFWPRGETGG